MTLDAFETYFPLAHRESFWEDQRDGLDSAITEAPPMPSVTTREEEDAREHNWARFIGECRDFAASEKDGYAAVLRAVAEAMKGQGELFRG